MMQFLRAALLMLLCFIIFMYCTTQLFSFGIFLFGCIRFHSYCPHFCVNTHMHKLKGIVHSNRYSVQTLKSAFQIHTTNGLCKYGVKYAQVLVYLWRHLMMSWEAEAKYSWNVDVSSLWIEQGREVLPLGVIHGDCGSCAVWGELHAQITLKKRFLHKGKGSITPEIRIRSRSLDGKNKWHIGNLLHFLRARKNVAARSQRLLTGDEFCMLLEKLLMGETKICSFEFFGENEGFCIARFKPWDQHLEKGLKRKKRLWEIVIFAPRKRGCKSSKFPSVWKPWTITIIET